jgi:formate hydrogenlyase subunit 3/multisubunit Na+/H+ antiporter MnhD subunit
MTRKTHTILFGLGLLGVTVLFTLLVFREILVRLVGYEANGVDPVMLAMFVAVGVPTFACVVTFAAPKFFADMFLNDTYPRPFSGPRNQAEVDRATANLRALGLLLEDRPSEENVVTNRGEQDGSAHGGSIKSKKVD